MKTVSSSDEDSDDGSSSSSDFEIGDDAYSEDEIDEVSQDGSSDEKDVEEAKPAREMKGNQEYAMDKPPDVGFDKKGNLMLGFYWEGTFNFILSRSLKCFYSCLHVQFVRMYACSWHVLCICV